MNVLAEPLVIAMPRPRPNGHGSMRDPKVTACVLHAVGWALEQCCNSHINEFTSAWLVMAKDVAGYAGPVEGPVDRARIYWTQWVEQHGLPEIV